ncbi:MAG TPA: hypothetical protein PK400_07495 [Phycisphaerales bacterium]|nr:hypothetical protein [Phycisphaerales bacterium]
MIRRGGVLLEVLLSLALFVGAGAVAISAMRSVFVAIDRSTREHLAVDLARSKMAELEAGLITLADLRGVGVREVGSHTVVDDALGFSGAVDLFAGWVCEVRTRRTEFAGLTLVELTVREERDDEDAVSFTLRQLMRLREIDPEEYEQDELLRGLPMGETQP